MAVTASITSFDGTRLAYESAALDDVGRPLAICTHGFPDSPHTWRHLATELVAGGFRVVMPYLRGYAPSDVPADGCVQTGASSLDLIELHEQLGGDDRAVALGHDWGAPITYGAVAHAPDRWSKVVGLAVPPGAAVGAAFLTNTDQLKRSWYMFFFQHPLADLVVPADDLAFIDMIWRDWAPGYDATDDLVQVKHALRDPANLGAAIGYYRATLGGVAVRDDLADVQAATQVVPPRPTLYLHGADDPCIGAEVASSAEAMAGEARAHTTFVTVPDAAHFLHLERPDIVNQHILEFLT